MAIKTGGCQCGRIRYSVDTRDEKAYFCHCRMCQRAMGNVLATYINVRKSDVTWTTQPPEHYASSSFAHRGFCAHCGTPLSFGFDTGEWMDITVGSMDDPTGLGFKHHFGVESRVEDFRHTEGYPEIPTKDYPALVERWEAHYGKMPD